jgi:hypothetical protein
VNAAKLAGLEESRARVAVRRAAADQIAAHLRDIGR